jgi:predicted DNA-binding ribbon-helix-helix protein
VSDRPQKRSVRIAGHKTSISLEPVFWDLLKTHAETEGRSINQLVEEIDRKRSGNLSSAIRVFLVKRLRG